MNGAAILPDTGEETQPTSWTLSCLGPDDLQDLLVPPLRSLTCVLLLISTTTLCTSSSPVGTLSSLLSGLPASSLASSSSSFHGSQREPSTHRSGWTLPAKSRQWFLSVARHYPKALKNWPLPTSPSPLPRAQDCSAYSNTKLPAISPACHATSCLRTSAQACSSSPFLSLWPSQLIWSPFRILTYGSAKPSLTIYRPK